VIVTVPVANAISVYLGCSARVHLRNKHVIPDTVINFNIKGNNCLPSFLRSTYDSWFVILWRVPNQNQLLKSPVLLDILVGLLEP